MQDKINPYILVFGAAVVDIIGFSSVKYKQYDSNAGRIKMSFGGVSRNIAENMARVGVNTKFISILGNDEKGRGMLEHSKIVGYDMSESLILNNGATPTYMAILDENGEMVSGIADMKSINEMNFDFIDSKADIIRNSEYTFLDADDPENLEYLLTKFHGDTKFILDPISACKAKKIKHLIKYFHTIKPNRHEAEVLVEFEITSDEELIKAGEHILGLGVKNVFISLDANGVYYTNGEESGKIKANNIIAKNVTGAGDSFVAGLGYGYINNLSIVETVKFAIAMSTITVCHEATINPDMCYKLVHKKKRDIDWTEFKF